MTEALTTIRKLEDVFNLPALLVIPGVGPISSWTYGSPLLKQWFVERGDTEEFRILVKKEVEALLGRSNEAARPKSSLKDLNEERASDPEKLDLPLEVMSWNDCVSWLTKEIIRCYHVSRKGTKKRIPWTLGYEELK